MPFNYEYNFLLSLRVMLCKSLLEKPLHVTINKFAPETHVNGAIKINKVDNLWLSINMISLERKHIITILKLNSALFKHVPAYLYVMNWTHLLMKFLYLSNDREVLTSSCEKLRCITFFGYFYFNGCYQVFPVTEIQKVLWTILLWTWVIITKTLLPQQCHITA